MIIFHEILCRNIWLYFMAYFGEKSDYTVWQTLQKYVITFYEILHRNF